MRLGGLIIGAAVALTANAASARGVPTPFVVEEAAVAPPESTVMPVEAVVPPVAPVANPIAVVAAARHVAASLPWSLRPAGVANVVRLDGAIAIHDGGAAVAATLLGVIKVRPNLGLLVRSGVAYEGAAGVDEAALANLVVGIVATPEMTSRWRLTLFSGVALPTGSGGGAGSVGEPVPIGYKAQTGAQLARGAMDNMLFAPNYVGLAFGMGTAYVGENGFTFVAETTLFALAQTREAGYELDGGKVNLTTGVHGGYTIGGLVTISVEARYQRWISTPTAVEKDETRRESVTVGLGVRTTIELVKGGLTVRPGLAYFEPLDAPLATLGYHMIVADLPLSF